MNPILKEGEIICDKCNGSGVLSEKIGPGNRVRSSLCEKCYGTGKLDWIENIVGKKFELNQDRKTSMDIVCEYNEPDVRKNSMEMWEMKRDYMLKVVNKIIENIPE